MNQRRKVLFLTQEFPYPPDGGGKIRDALLCNLLTTLAEVELLCFRSAIQPGQASMATDNPRFSLIFRDKEPIYSRIFYPFRSYILNGFSQNMAQALKERSEKGKILWISRLTMAKYIPLAKSLGYRVILDEHNVETDLIWPDSSVFLPLRLYRQLSALQFESNEKQMCSSADLVIATSQRDADIFKQWGIKAPVRIIPNPIDVSWYENTPLHSGKTQNFLFTGTLNYHPNVQGLLWFVDKVLPKLRKTIDLSKLSITVAGANPKPALRSTLEKAGVTVTANPQSMLPLLSQASVVFVPLLSGSGTRLKIIEALAAKKAVVSTSKGAEGLNLVHGTHLRLADDPDTFASSMALLANSEQERKKLGQNGFLKIKEIHHWANLQGKMEEAINFLCQGVLNKPNTI